MQQKSDQDCEHSGLGVYILEAWVRLIIKIGATGKIQIQLWVQRLHTYQSEGYFVLGLCQAQL